MEHTINRDLTKVDPSELNYFLYNHPNGMPIAPSEDFFVEFEFETVEEIEASRAADRADK